MAVYTPVNDPGSFFNVFPYTGTADTWTAHTGMGFQPNMTWMQGRSSAANWNAVCDSIRGVESSGGPSPYTTYGIYSNSDTQEESSDNEYLNGYQSDGFTVGKNGSFGAEGEEYVAYCWKMATTSGKSTTGETITPTAYSIDTTACQGIYTYDGTGSAGQINHGLGRVPGLILVKRLDGGSVDWAVYQGFRGYNAGATTAPGEIDMTLNDSNARTTSSTMWDDTDATSTLFTVGSNNSSNDSGQKFVAYVFCDVPGYCLTGKYPGNSNAAAGPYVYTGFEPAFVWVKNRDSGGPAGYGWAALSNKLGMDGGVTYGYNEIIQSSYLDQTAAAASNVNIDLLSNGFRIRGTGSNQNGGDKYTFTAFAKNPFVNAEGVPTNAR